MAAAGISIVEAKTLDRSSGYRPCEATRAFWERNGFIHIDTSPARLAARQPGSNLRSRKSAQPDDKHASQSQLTGT